MLFLIFFYKLCKSIFMRQKKLQKNNIHIMDEKKKELISFLFT